MALAEKGDQAGRRLERSNADLKLKPPETEILEAKAETEFFLDLLSHDVRNLIQISVGYIELAQQSADMEEVKTLMAKGLGIMQDTALIIDNVRKLQFLRHENKERKPVDLHKVLSDLQSRHALAAGRHITINLKAAPGSIVSANELVADVFSNLISNSIKHSDPEKPLVIDINVDRTKEKGTDFWRCSLEDNGPGISRWAKDMIFMRFKHGDKQAHGKGLGLHIARTLVEDYGGKIWVEDRVSSDYTKGARFVVVLPAA